MALKISNKYFQSGYESWLKKRYKEPFKITLANDVNTRLSIWIGSPSVECDVLDKDKCEYTVRVRKPFWVSVKRKEKCLYSRRNGYLGTLIFGYSVMVRLFNKDIL